MIIDELETNPKYKRILTKVNEKAEAICQEEGIEKYSLGYCHFFWAIKKDILKEEYNLDWKSPSELNPDILFD